MTIQESIEVAFADVAYPGDDRITEHKDCLECDDIRNHFRGATWRSHTVAELQQFQSALPLFTPEALQYFLPAFMLVSLGAWHEADDIPPGILHTCLPSDSNQDPGLRQYKKVRFEIFTKRQRKAIADYLRAWAGSGDLMAEVYADDISAAIERLLNNEFPESPNARSE